MPSAPCPADLEASLPPAYGDDLGCAGIKRDRHLVCAFLTLGLWVILLLKLLSVENVASADVEHFFDDDGSFYGLFFGVYALYLLECVLSGTHSFLRHRHGQDGAESTVFNLRRTPPTIHWSIQNYHYETRHRSRTVTDSNGNKRTEHYTERGTDRAGLCLGPRAPLLLLLLLTLGPCVLRSACQHPLCRSQLRDFHLAGPVGNLPAAQVRAWARADAATVGCANP